MANLLLWHMQNFDLIRLSSNFFHVKALPIIARFRLHGLQAYEMFVKWVPDLKLDCMESECTVCEVI